MFAEGSAVLVSGNKAYTPVIGIYHSHGRSLLRNRNSAPCGLNVLLDNSIAQIDSLFCKHKDNLKENSEWYVLLNDTTEYKKEKSVVGPLIKTKWGQSISNDGQDTNAYNEFAPGEDSCVRGHHCPAGCVAVAMGQIMKFWNYPFFLANSNVTFEWCNMTNKLMVTNPCYDINKHAINNLLQDCGESVDMIYTCSGSEAYAEDINQALVSRYLYNASADYYKVEFYNPQASLYTLLSKLRDELDAGRPVIMSALEINRGGHSFICDGYNGKMYYFNWGWNGEYDGLFDFWDLNPDVYCFNTLTYRINYNIIPAIFSSGNSQQLDLSVYYNVLSIIAPGLMTEAYKIAPTEFFFLESASDTCPISWRTIPENKTAIYQAQEEILLRDGFIVEPGAEFTAQIVPCSNCETRGSEAPVNDEPEWDMAGTGNEGTEEVLDAIATTATNPIELHPNPASGEVIVTVDGELQSIVIYNAQGQPVGGWKIHSLAENSATLDVSALSAGPYLVRIATPAGTVTRKLLVQHR